MASGSDVFLLGAGFSRAISPAMPLASGLTAAVKDELKTKVPALALDRIPYLDSDFEKALSYLTESQPWLAEAERLRNRAMFLDMAEAVHAVLARAQGIAVQTQPPGWLRELAYWMHSTQAIALTLNYDTLLEMALSDICLPSGQLFDSLYLRPFAFPAQQGALGIGELQTLRLLKLHGSLHWTYSGSDQYFGEDIHDSDIPRWSIAASEYKPSPATDGRVPLVVPPTLNKTRYFENEKIRWVWRQASAALCQARRLFCIGYSLPDGDLLMRFLIHDSKVCDRQIPFYIVNTDLASPAHYSKDLPNCFVPNTEYVRSEPTIVEHFAADLTSTGLGDASSVVTLSPVSSELRKMLRLVSLKPSIHRNVVDDTTFWVEAIDAHGILLTYQQLSGRAYVPWSLFEGIIGRAKVGALRYLKAGFSIKDMITGLHSQLFSLLLSVGALEESHQDGYVYFRPCVKFS
jgi:hypothetical protein